jgi:hypothetical protein
MAQRQTTFLMLPRHILDKGGRDLQNDNVVESIADRRLEGMQLRRFQAGSSRIAFAYSVSSGGGHLAAVVSGPAVRSVSSATVSASAALGRGVRAASCLREARTTFSQPVFAPHAVDRTSAPSCRICLLIVAGDAVLTSTARDCTAGAAFCQKQNDRSRVSRFYRTESITCGECCQLWYLPQRHKKLKRHLAFCAFLSDSLEHAFRANCMILGSLEVRFDWLFWAALGFSGGSCWSRCKLTGTELKALSFFQLESPRE